MLKSLIRKLLAFGGNWLWRVVWKTPLEAVYKNERQKLKYRITFLPSHLQSFLVINYHRVHPDAGKRLMIDAISPDLFHRQIDFLSNEFHVLSLNELSERLRQRDIPPKAVCLTFDDGYRDNYQYAFPILRRYRTPATIFLVTGAISTANYFWFDRIFQALENTTLERVEFAINGRKEIWNLKQPDQKLRLAESVLGRLKRLNNKQRTREIERFCHALGLNGRYQSEREVLNWSEVQEMAKNRIEFGVHTHSHTILSVLSNEQVREEMQRSIAVLMEHLGTPVTWFAYPNGRRNDFEEVHKQILQESGFHGAFTTIWGLNDIQSDRYALARVPGGVRSLEELRILLLQVKFGQI